MRIWNCIVILLVNLIFCMSFYRNSALAGDPELEWAVNGVAVSLTETGHNYAVMVPDSEGGAIVIWDQGIWGGAQIDAEHSIWRYYDKVIAQRINRDGQRRWQDEGIRLSMSSNFQFNNKSVPDGNGGAIVAWTEVTPDFATKKVCVQRIDINGNRQWGDNGLVVCSWPGVGGLEDIISDGRGGAVVVWSDTRITRDIFDLYAQYIDGNGNILWQGDGVPISTARLHQRRSKIVRGSNNEVIIVWEDDRNSGSWPDTDIYAQKVDFNGNLLWQADGVPVITSPDEQLFESITEDGNGGAIIVWSVDNSVTSTDIYGQRIDNSGRILWGQDGVSVCRAGGVQCLSEIVSDGLNGAIITWEDYRDGESLREDIYAQRIDSNGNVLWQADGEPIINASGAQRDNTLISDGNNGAIVVWRDSREWNVTGDDIYAQRIDQDGHLLWRADGQPICKAVGNQRSPAIILGNNLHETIISWIDFRGPGGDIFAQKFCINLPPEFSNNNLFQYEVDEGEELSFTVSANDHDGDTLIYSVEGLPQDVSQDNVLNSSTGEFNWIPGHSHGDGPLGEHIYLLQFHATDGLDTADLHVTVIVHNVKPNLTITKAYPYSFYTFTLVKNGSGWWRWRLRLKRINGVIVTVLNNGDRDLMADEYFNIAYAYLRNRGYSLFQRVNHNGVALGEVVRVNIPMDWTIYPLKFKVDCFNEIDEANEGDNEYPR